MELRPELCGTVLKTCWPVGLCVCVCVVNNLLSQRPSREVDASV